MLVFPNFTWLHSYINSKRKDNPNIYSKAGWFQLHSLVLIRPTLSIRCHSLPGLIFGVRSHSSMSLTVHIFDLPYMHLHMCISFRRTLTYPPVAHQNWPESVLLSTSLLPAQLFHNYFSTAGWSDLPEKEGAIEKKGFSCPQRLSPSFLVCPTPGDLRLAFKNLIPSAASLSRFDKKWILYMCQKHCLFFI